MVLAIKRDHPRVCGEKVHVFNIVCNGLGSPPRVRGKDSFVISSWGFTRDHPRMCGEKHMVTRALTLSLGSPPHVRGKATGAGPATAGRGITPACAGKSGK